MDKRRFARWIGLALSLLAGAVAVSLVLAWTRGQAAAALIGGEGQSAAALLDETGGPYPGGGEYRFARARADARAAANLALRLPAAPTQTHSVDAVLVFEGLGSGGATRDIHYSIYGHNPAIPVPVSQTLTWNWWSIGAGGVSDIANKTRPIATTQAGDFRPDVAFSREGFALAVWGTLEEYPNTFDCTPPGEPAPVAYSRYNGSIRYSRLVPQANGDVAWSIPGGGSEGLLESTDNITAATYVVDHLYSNPSIAIDSNGIGLALWTHLAVTRTVADCGVEASMRILSSRWISDHWSVETVVHGWEPTLPECIGPFTAYCEHVTDLAMTARLGTTTSDVATRQQALAVWLDYARTEVVDCGFGITNSIPIFWPRYRVWSGNQWEDPAGTVPGLPPPGAIPYMALQIYQDARLGISPDQYGNARLVFPVERISDACTASNQAREIRYSNWISATQAFSDTAFLQRGRGPDVAHLQDNTAIAVYALNQDDDPAIAGEQVKWATAAPASSSWMTQSTPVTSGAPGSPLIGATTIAALHAAGTDAERAVAVWSVGGGLSWSQRLGSGGWSGAAVLLPEASAASHPELAAHTGSPSLPHAEWTVFDYIAGDMYALGADERPNNTMRRLEETGSTSLANAVALFDSQEDPDHTRYYYIKQGVDSGRTERGDIGTANVGDPAILRDFIAWTHEHYPAGRRILVLSDHGHGWEGACVNINGDQLNLPEIKQALTGAGVRFQAAIFEACMMAMVEVAYQIRGSADYMLASQEVMLQHRSVDTPGTSWDERTVGFRQDRMLSQLIDDAHMPLNNNAPGVNRGFVQRMIDEYAAANDPADDGMTFSAIDLGQVPALATDVHALARAMTQWITDTSVTTATRTTRKAALRAHMAATQGVFGNPTYRDLFHFTDRARGDGALPAAITGAATTVFNRRGQVVVAEWHDLTNSGNPGLAGGVSKDNATGLNIWMPLSDGQYAAGLTYDLLDFIQNFWGGGTLELTWSGFLKQVHGSTDLSVRLESSSFDAYVRVEDSAGNFVGGIDPVYDCAPFCASNFAEPICGIDDGAIRLWLPEDFTPFTWTVSRLPAGAQAGTFPEALPATVERGSDPFALALPAPYTLTIQIIKDGEVVQEYVQSGVLEAGESVTGAFRREVLIYLPIINQGP